MEQEDNKASAKPKKKNKTLLIIIVLLPLIFLGGAYGYFYGLKANKSTEVNIKDIKQYPLQTYTVNLSDVGSARYIRTTITLEYFDKKVAEEIEIKKHRINDIVITLLREKGVNDLNSPEKTQNLKNELLNKINAELTEGKLIGLYFNEFIIQ